jgi:hypothetical protein
MGVKKSHIGCGTALHIGIFLSGERSYPALRLQPLLIFWQWITGGATGEGIELDILGSDTTVRVILTENSDFLSYF